MGIANVAVAKARGTGKSLHQLLKKRFPLFFTEAQWLFGEGTVLERWFLLLVQWRTHLKEDAHRNSIAPFKGPFHSQIKIFCIVILLLEIVESLLEERIRVDFVIRDARTENINQSKAPVIDPLGNDLREMVWLT